MTERGFFALLGALAVIALVIFMMSPQPPGSVGAKVRDAAQNQIHETAGRLNDAFDAARKDAQRHEQ